MDICPLLLQGVWPVIKTAAHCTPGSPDYTLGTTLVFILKLACRLCYMITE